MTTKATVEIRIGANRTVIRNHSVNMIHADEEGFVYGYVTLNERIYVVSTWSMNTLDKWYGIA